MSGLEFTAQIIDSLAWPTAVVAMVVIFRGRLRELLGSLTKRITHLKAAGFEATFDPERDNAAIGQVGSELLSWAPAGQAAVVIAEPMDDDIHVSDDLHVVRLGVQAAEQAERKRRAQLALLLDKAALWGWSQARAEAFTTFPHPVIEWDEHGEPRIAYGTTDDRHLEDALLALNEPA